MNSLSVIIPTFNRKHILRKVLEAYLRQSGPALVGEFIIIDDGSTDGTKEVVLEYANQLPIRYLAQSNCGPAISRNRGIREAKGNIVLFVDDDIIPSVRLVAEHLAIHERYPDPMCAVQGYVTWSPEVKATPFMRWYGERGALFGFGHLRNNTPVDFRYFYTCNVSLKVELLRKHGVFSESFNGAAYEDTELAYRLHKVGMRLLYSKSALAYHFQHFTFEEACKRYIRVAAGQEVLSSTEAGQFLLQRESRLTKRFGKRIAPIAVWFLQPLRRLIDSKVQLPSILYRSFYWYYTSFRYSKSI